MAKGGPWISTGEGKYSCRRYEAVTNLEVGRAPSPPPPKNCRIALWRAAGHCPARRPWRRWRPWRPRRPQRRWRPWRPGRPWRPAASLVHRAPCRANPQKLGATIYYSFNSFWHNDPTFRHPYRAIEYSYNYRIYVLRYRKVSPIAP